MTWEEVTAVSTLTLAAVTYGLGRSTRRLAREANAETRANWQPVLMVAAENDDGSGVGAVELSTHDRKLTVRLRNVGRGPALTVTVALQEEGDDKRAGAIFRGRAHTDIVAPGDTTVFEWRDFDAPRPPKDMGLNFWAQLDGMITYGDVGYVRYETEVKVGFRVDGVATLIDQRFLGATRDRIGRVERLRYRLLIWTLAVEARIPSRFRGLLAHRLARRAWKRLRRAA